MSLKPDHTAADLRKLMDQFATAAESTTPAAQANRIRQQLSEMDYGGGRSPHAGMGLPRDDLDLNPAGRKEIIVKPETVKKTRKDVGDRLDQAFAQAYDDKGVKEGSAGWMLRQDPALAKKVRDNTQGYKDLKKMAGKPVPKKDEKGVAEQQLNEIDAIQLQHLQKFSEQVAQMTPAELEALNQYIMSVGLGSLGAVAGTIGAFSFGDMFMSVMNRTMRLAKKKTEVDAEEVIKLQRQIASIHKRLKTLKSEPAIAKYQNMLKQAYEVLAELEARQDNKVAEGYDTSGAYDKWDPKHPDFVKNYRKFQAQNPGASLADFVAHIKKGVAEGRVDQIAPGGADYSKHSTDELKAMLRPGIMGRNELKFKTLIRQELRKREQQGVAEHSMYGDEEVSWEKGGRRAPTGAFRNPAVVKTDKSIGTRVSDIGPGGKEYNVKTDKEWDKQKGVAEGRAGADDTDTVGFSVNSEAAYNAVMRRFSNSIDHDETSGVMYTPSRLWPQIEMTAFDADPESGAVRVEDDVMEQGVAEAKSLARRVRVIKTGETGTIRQIKHGAYKGAPKTYYVDLDNGGQADNLPASALRLIKGEVAEVKSKTHSEHSAMDTPAVQGAIAGMKQRHEKEPFDLEKARALGQKLAARNRDPRRK